MSKLILCGGTGVHVGLAYLRLHLVSKYLGNYDKPLPEIIVVDRDSGTAADTALKSLNSLCSNWPEPLGRPMILNPTPQGETYRNATQIKQRFPTSPLANAMFSERQLAKDFSLGMLASPALGAAVFELRTKERAKNAPDEPTDQALRLLLNSDKTQVAIAASLVGGTGASVAPSLTKMMAERHEVCIAPLHLFFKFNESAGDDAKKSLAQLRNREMQENAHSATAFFGDELAKVAALIPIGLRSHESRVYTDDNDQPTNESAAHLLAAAPFIQHFKNAITPGLYALSGNKIKGSTEAELTGAFLINGVSLQLLANRTAALAVTLDSIANLSTASQSFFGGDVPSVLSKFVSKVETRETLKKWAMLFNQQVEWFKSLKIPIATDIAFFTESNVRQRLRTQIIYKVDDSNVMALNVLNWLAQWVSEQFSQPAQSSTDVTTFWPKSSTSNVGSNSGSQPGSVERSDEGSLKSTLETEFLTANGWPAKNAAESFFKYSLEMEGKLKKEDNKIAQRQLEIMLAGLVSQSVKISKNNDNSAELRGLFDDWPEYILTYDGAEIGFTSKYTLLVPKPDSDTIMKKLWEYVNSINDGLSNWRTDAWSDSASQYISRVSAWLIASKLSCGVTIWNRHAGETTTKIFGIRTEALKVNTNGGDKTIFLPSYASDRAPSHETKNEKSWTQVPELVNIGKYSTENYFCPKRVVSRRFIWQEHLEEIKALGKIQNFWIENDELFVYVNNTVVKVLDLLPLVRANVFTKLSKKFQGVENSARLADSPIRWEFYDLLKLFEKAPATIATSGGKVAGTLIEKPEAGSQIVASGPTVNGTHVRWVVHVKGIAEPISIQTTLDEEITTAEWLVWPNFKTPNHSWKAYYCYSNSDNDNIAVRALSRISLGFAVTEIPSTGAAPVNYTSTHTGGAPFAFCATQTTNSEQFGLFLFELPDKSVSDAVEIAVDFGTSNSAVAWRTITEGDNRNGQAVELLNNTLNSTAGLTFVVLGFLAEKKRDEIAANGSWFPSFAGVSGKTLYSELISAPRIKHKEDPATYNVPLKHYSIPTSKCIKADETVARDFKWLGNSPKGVLFQGQYLTLLLEMALANIIAIYGVPTAAKLTMLYPIRAEKQLGNYDNVVQAVVKRISISTSIPLSIYYLDESRAAFTDPHTNNKIGMVADLGGGTLDIYINGSSELADRPNPIADSILVGGNKLTKCIENFLPPAWKVGLLDGAPKSDSILRRWLRESNMHALLLNGEHETITNNIAGFQNNSDSTLCMITCDNYFKLLAEYITRNLVAYLKECRNDQLTVDIKLSGNGWRLFYAERSLASAFAEIVKKIVNCVEVRCVELKIVVPKFVSSKLDEETLKIGPVIDALKIPGSELDKIVTAKAFTNSIATFNLTNNVHWHDRAPFALGTLFEGVTPNFKLYKGVSRTDSAVEATTALLANINDGIKHQPVPDGKFDNASASIWEVLVEEIKP